MPLPRLPSEALAAELARVATLRQPAPAEAPQRRRFEAAAVDRLTSDWMTTSALIDAELRADLDRLRQRSRDLAKNNAYAANFLRAVRRNIVGPDGPVLQARVVDPNGTPDSLANRAIEAAWLEQCRPGNFEVTGKHGMASALGVIVSALARDGEALLRVVKGNSYGRFGFQVQLLDAARLATTLQRERTTGSNAIVMGVEVDDYGRPVAYHLHTGPAAHGVLTGTTERIPATEIRHIFFGGDAEQHRGIPWMAAAIKELHNLKGYREAAVIAARVGASKMGFFSRKDGGGADPVDVADGQGSGKDAGEFYSNVAPGEFGVLPDGYGFETFDPAYPHDQFDSFNKAVLRGVAAGFGVSYHGLSGDLEGVTFSSIRAGVLEERDEWMFLQGLLREHVLTPLYEEWLEWALLRGQIVQAGGAPLPASKLWKFRAHIWQMKRWAWVDPLKDIRAGIEAIDARLASPQQIAAQAGRDIEDVLDDIKAFQDMAAAKGIALEQIATQLAPLPPDE
jgi:lambda family phage portal protein